MLKLKYRVNVGGSTKLNGRWWNVTDHRNMVVFTRTRYNKSTETMIVNKVSVSLLPNSDDKYRMEYYYVRPIKGVATPFTETECYTKETLENGNLADIMSSLRFKSV